MENLTEVKQKVGSEIIQNINGYKTKLGTVNSELGKCFYLNLGGWVKPIDDTDLNIQMKTFERILKFWVDDASKQLLQGKLDPRMPIIKIVDYADSINGSATNKTRVNNTYTYFSIELTIFFKEKQTLRDDNFKDLLLLLFYSLEDYLSENPQLDFKSRK